MESRDIIFINELLKSLAISLIAYTTGYFLKVLTECESWFHRSFKNLSTVKYFKMLLAHLSVVALFLYLNLSQIKYPDETHSFLMIETVKFNDTAYNCPEE